MDLRRILKMLTARWWIILIAAIGGAIIGIVIAVNLNNNIQPQWRAEAPVAFAQLDEGADPIVDVDAELIRAQLLLEETLIADPDLSIEKDATENMLLFAAVRESADKALGAVRSLRGEYEALGVTVLSKDQIEATKAAVLIDIDRLKGEISVLEVSEPETENPAISAQRAALEAEIQTLLDRQAQLQIWIKNPELRPTEAEYAGVEPATVGAEVQEPVVVTVGVLLDEKRVNAVVLNRLQTDLEALPEPVQPQELDGKPMLELEALQLDVAELEAQYVELLRRGEGKPAGGLFIEPAVTDVTTRDLPVALSGLIGFLVGGLLATAGLIRLDRTQGPMWTATDLKGLVSLGVVNRDRTDGLQGDVWYPDSSSKRRRDIQTLRAAMDAVTEERPTIVGFSGVGTADDEVGELAADLAVAYAVAGRRVLLIDSNAFHPNSLPEFGGHIKGLNGILTTQMPQDEASVAINDLLDELPQVMACLTALRVEGDIPDPIDAFASQNYRLLMDIARSKYDIVIHAGPGISSPLSDAVVRRVDLVVLVGSIGTTTAAQVNAAAHILEDRRTALAGVVLLEGRRQPLSSQFGAIARGDTETLTTSPSQVFAIAVKKLKRAAHVVNKDSAIYTEPDKTTEAEEDDDRVVTVNVHDT